MRESQNWDLKSVGRLYHLVKKKKSLGEAKEDLRKVLLGIDSIELGSKVKDNSAKARVKPGFQTKGPK